MTAEEFKQARQAMGLSQQALAPLLGVGWRAVYRYESGERKVSKTVSLLLTRLVKERGNDAEGKTAGAVEGDTLSKRRSGKRDHA